MQYRPTFNRVLIEEQEQKKSNSLIYIPDQNSAYGVAKILKLGPTAGYRDGKQLQKLTVGDIVVFQKSAVIEVKAGGETFKLISDDSILVEFLEDRTEEKEQFRQPAHQGD